MGYFFEGTTLSGGSGGGGDSANVSLSNLNSAGNGRFTSKANIGLDNLSSDGQMIIDTQNGTISNCILEIPQTFTIEQSGNTFTLKSGSTVAVVNRDTYTTVTTNQDFSVTLNNDGQYFLVFSGWSLINWITPSSIGSGTSLPADNSQYGQFFLIDGNKGSYYLWKPETSTWESWGGNGSYPLAVVKVENGVASFAKDSNGNDMIFNGAGFIGHHAFVYPNVKSLMPNGFNDDGSLKSVAKTTNTLTVVELSGTAQTGYTRGLTFANNNYIGQFSYREIDDLSELDGTYYYSYVKNQNQLYTGAGVAVVRIALAYFILSGSTVTDFTIRQPVRTATVEMLKDKQNDLTTVSGYDATATQVLKHINGVLTWVTEE